MTEIYVEEICLRMEISNYEALRANCPSGNKCGLRLDHIRVTGYRPTDSLSDTALATDTSIQCIDSCPLVSEKEKVRMLSIEAGSLAVNELGLKARYEYGPTD